MSIPRSPIVSEFETEEQAASYDRCHNGFKHGRLSGTREMVVHPNYLVVYRVTEHVEIVMVLHTRQEYPRDVIGPHHSTSRQ
ncbi:MAG: type II toxin-antitoxin system RelE/ParE family toxin [Pseudomonas veronii]|jgi:addiction module RelE/StbE family toxin|nr:type II toxin-antitoxin system RelE/ParE family toxin [Pseudomonas veronii]